jgi:diphosphomevalonate decarboxylase
MIKRINNSWINNMKQDKVIWRSPSNIAIIKYWGKKGIQQGINPSISFSLSSSYTETEIQYQLKTNAEGISIKFFFEGERKLDFEKRILNYLTSVQSRFELLKKYELRINSKNTFPHSAGIASSASAMSSLVLGLLSIEQRIKNIPEQEFLKQASGLSRLASGSAARSVYGGFTLWGKLDGIQDSSDDCAIPFLEKIHPVFQKLNDSILIVHAGKKAVSSSEGHRLMENHPFKEARIQQATIHCKDLISVLKDGDFSRFAEICENEALSLHGLMMNSNPSFILMQPETLSVIQKVRAFRETTGEKICFTLDAGPNVHLIYPAEEQDEIKDFIRKELLVHCKNRDWIDDKLGAGPQQID